MSPLNCPSSNNTRQIMKTFTLSFSEAELETIANAMEDYMQYDDEKLILNFYLAVYLLRIELTRFKIK